jgi:hypothetical protein
MAQPFARMGDGEMRELDFGTALLQIRCRGLRAEPAE